MPQNTIKNHDPKNIMGGSPNKVQKQAAKTSV